MRKNRNIYGFVAVTVLFILLSANNYKVFGQNISIVEFPGNYYFYQNSTYVIDGEVGYTPTFGGNVLWSFSTITGELLDNDGLALPSPGTASDPFIFSNNRIGIPGWFPNQGIFVADVTNPSNMLNIGSIVFPPTTNIQGQNVEVDDDGVIGYVAGFPDDTLYSFSVDTMALVDPDGLSLPGNPDRIARGGDRVALVDTTNGRIMVADVSNPANMTLAGIIELPGTNTFGSNDNIVVAADGRTAFVTSNERVLYSFDLILVQLLDPNGFAFGNQSFADNLAIHGNTVACIWSRGLTFVDVSDPTNLTLISNADFEGQTIAPQGDARVAFSADGSKAAMPVIYPDMLVYTFDVATGKQVAEPLAVGDQPNFLNIYQPGNRIGVLCSGIDSDNIYLISNLFGLELADPWPGIAGETNYLRAYGATTGEQVHFVYGLHTGSKNVPGCPGLTVGINNPKIAGSAIANAQGEATLSSYVPGNASGVTVNIQAVERAGCTISNLVVYKFP